ncbi:hypothetical protein GGD64_002788 [Bradyrhizobium sp. CIR3A]|nr:hypothetical protein [Bradyrhizobium sp. CIR3A]
MQAAVQGRPSQARIVACSARQWSKDSRVCLRKATIIASSSAVSTVSALFSGPSSRHARRLA